MKTQLSDSEIVQCLIEAEQRKADSSLPTDVRIRSFETYAILLREASNRGFDYAEIIKKAKDAK